MATPKDVSFLEDIPVEVSIEVGRRRMAIRDLAQIEVDDVVELEQHVDAPISLVIGGRVVARGELVVVGQRMALRVTELVGGVAAGRKAS
jgi:flagellar motor switch protein FliN